MSSIKEKLDAIDDALGQYVRVNASLFISVMGDQIIYTKATNRLSVNGVVLTLGDDGTATLSKNRKIEFKQMNDDTWHLAKRINRPKKDKKITVKTKRNGK